MFNKLKITVVMIITSHMKWFTKISPCFQILLLFSGNLSDCVSNEYSCQKRYLYKRQFHKMVKHSQTIRRQIANRLFECV